MYIVHRAESSSVLKVPLRPRTQSQLTRTPDISPADMYSVDKMAAVLSKVMVFVSHFKTDHTVYTFLGEQEKTC